MFLISNFPTMLKRRAFSSAVASVAANNVKPANASSLAAEPPTKSIRSSTKSPISRNLSIFYRGPWNAFSVITRWAGLGQSEKETVAAKYKKPTWHQFIDRRSVSHDWRLTLAYYAPFGVMTALDSWVWLMLVPVLPPALWLTFGNQSERWWAYKFVPSYARQVLREVEDDSADKEELYALPPKNPPVKACRTLLDNVLAALSPESRLKQRILKMQQSSNENLGLDRILMRDIYDIFKEQLEYAQELPRASELSRSQLQRVCKVLDCGHLVPSKIYQLYRLHREVERRLFEDRYLDSSGDEAINMSDAMELLTHRVGVPEELINKLEPNTMISLLVQYLKFTNEILDRHKEYQSVTDSVAFDKVDAKLSEYETKNFGGTSNHRTGTTYLNAQGILSLALARTRVNSVCQDLLSRESK